MLALDEAETPRASESSLHTECFSIAAEAVTPDRFVWNAAVAACETSSEWKMALAILETMSLNRKPQSQSQPQYSVRSQILRLLSRADLP